jgi:hypothetical protein
MRTPAEQQHGSYQLGTSVSGVDPKAGVLGDLAAVKKFRTIPRELFFHFRLGVLGMGLR